jgi:UDP-N-acetylmuramoylalanine--D-glutamate ligase
MSWLSDLPVLVLGLGDSGLAMARWCASHGARVTVWDSRTPAPHAAVLQAEVPTATLIGGELQAAQLAGMQLVLKSPGLAPADPRIAALVDEARASAMAVLGELDLFARALADLKAERGYAPQVLAITGTNGKTTTTAMTALLVKRAGRTVATAGNIGPTMLDTLAAALARGDALPEVWVLELSSFQLEGGGTGARGFEPSAATVLNLTQDHLDWHGTMAAYTAAKARVFGSSAVMVINRDDPLVEALVPVPVPAAGKTKTKCVPRDVLRFGLDAPQQPGDFGLVVDNGMAWLVRALPAEDGPRKRGAKDAHESEPVHLQHLMPADALRVRGRHNAANALAALALATAIGCPLAPMLHGLREYSGEPHRVQWVATLGEVEAYDDSKGTNVGATVAALDGLGADKAPHKLVVILGGDGKGQDFSPLAAPVQRHARAVALIGRDAAAIGHALACTGVPMQHHDTLPAAVAWCYGQAQPGDAVLLSPACASLDMFRNYAHRAEVFVQAVQAHALEEGVA